MLLVFLLILALVLLAAIVYGLHRYQVRESASNADRQSPLPPLEFDSRAGLSDEEEVEAAEEAEEVEEVEEVEEDQPPPPSAPEDSAVNWMQLCQEYKSSGAFQDALAVCQLHFPQWGAFLQAATVVRAQIRAEQKLGNQVGSLLLQLYGLAACASFLHDRTEELPALTPRQLKQLPRSAWETLEMPYAQIGYAALRLLGKSDRRLLAREWGEPEQHVSARIYHRNAWLELLGLQAGAGNGHGPER